MNFINKKQEEICQMRYTVAELVISNSDLSPGENLNTRRWAKHLLKLIFWVHHSDYANYLHVDHASEATRFFLSRRAGDWVFQ